MKDKVLPSNSTVSEANWEKTPASVKALVLNLLSRVEELEKQFADLRAENIQLRAENELLKEKLQCNSQNSSQPPSEDKAKRVKSKKTRSRHRRGGQPGHPGNGPKLYAPEACERIENYYPKLTAAGPTAGYAMTDGRCVGLISNEISLKSLNARDAPGTWERLCSSNKNACFPFGIRFAMAP